MCNETALLTMAWYQDMPHARALTVVSYPEPLTSQLHPVPQIPKQPVLEVCGCMVQLHSATAVATQRKWNLVLSL